MHRRQDSNLQPAVLGTAALPVELRPLAATGPQGPRGADRRPFLGGPRELVERSVHVIHVVRGDTTAILHALPTTPVVDPLLPDHVLDTQFFLVIQKELGDPVALRGA